MTTAPFEPRPEVAPGQPDENVPAADPNRPGQWPDEDPNGDPMEQEREARGGTAHRSG